MFVVAVFVSYVFAFVFCLAFEMPVTNLDKLIFTPKKRNRARENGVEESVPLNKNGIQVDDIPLKPLIRGSSYKNPNSN